MVNNVNYHVHVNMVVIVLFKAIIQLHYVIVMNHDFMVINVKIYHHVHLNHVIWVELVLEMEHDLYVIVHQIVLEVNVKKMIHVNRVHVLGRFCFYNFNINTKIFFFFSIEIAHVIVLMIMYTNVYVIKFIQEKIVKVKKIVKKKYLNFI